MRLVSSAWKSVIESDQFWTKYYVQHVLGGKEEHMPVEWGFIGSPLPDVIQVLNFLVLIDYLVDRWNTHSERGR